MNQEREDRLDRDFRQLQREYDALPDDGPPELIDRAVRNLAHREASAGKIRRPWSFGWVHAVTSAAVVVLAVAIYTHQPDTGVDEALRVARPPSPKLRDIESETQPLQIPARRATAAEPALAREIRQRDTAGKAAEPAPNAVAAEQNEEALADLALADSAEVGAAQRAAKAVSATDVDDVLADPEKWLDDILELKRQGAEEAAARELQAFRAAWPDYPLPAELSD
jgi:hypothetical protein